jgi:enamine deaminase RidA (YjgF/YER057c/UK114 family)
MHNFISGTASIDPQGRVVHPGNVLRQLGRALDNIEGLLHAGGAGLADMMHLTVYLRDIADYRVVRNSLNERCPGLPVLVVLAPVCRPDWLIEMEGIAITANNQPGLPAF